MKKLILVTSFVLVASIVQAQAAVVSIKIQFLQNGAVLPTQVMTIPLPSGATCGQPKPIVPASVFINTTGRVVWEDPTNSILACISIQTGGVLFSLPLGNNYTATAAFIDDIGVSSAASLPSNSFTRGVRPLPPVPTGVLVLQ